MKIAVNPTGIPGVIHQNLRDIYIYIYIKKQTKKKIQCECTEFNENASRCSHKMINSK